MTRGRYCMLQRTGRVPLFDEGLIVGNLRDGYRETSTSEDRACTHICTHARTHARITDSFPLLPCGTDRLGNHILAYRLLAITPSIPRIYNLSHLLLARSHSHSCSVIWT